MRPLRWAAVEHAVEADVAAAALAGADGVGVLLGVEVGAHAEGIAVGEQEGELHLAGAAPVGSDDAAEDLDDADEHLLAVAGGPRAQDLGGALDLGDVLGIDCYAGGGVGLEWREHARVDGPRGRELELAGVLLGLHA